MELGEKIRLARTEAGLSQRQLCDGCITRNMLSQIENGSARPSMKTLAFLAQRLGKNVSFFLEETAVLSPNQSVMEAARRLYDEENYGAAAQALESYSSPDSVYDREQQILWYLIHLELAAQALEQGRDVYAKELLEKSQVETAYLSRELNRRRLLLLGRIRGQRVSAQLPSLDGELLLRAGEALEEGKTSRAAQLLDAAENRKEGHWCLLRGKVCMAEKSWKKAARLLQSAEGEFPEETAPLLEACFRELGDYKKAYEYAIRQKR